MVMTAAPPGIGPPGPMAGLAAPPVSLGMPGATGGPGNQMIGPMGPAGGGLPPGGPLGLPANLPALREARRMLRLRPFSLPERPKRRGRDGELVGIVPAKPTREALTAMLEERRRFWEKRNQEIAADLDLYYLRGAPEFKLTGKGGEEYLERVTPRAMVDKMANMAQRLRARFRAVPRVEAKPFVDAAQMCEDAAYEHLRRIDQQHEQRLQTGYMHDEAWYFAAMGWIASRHCLAPGEEWPFSVELHDPRCCYPEPSGGGVGQLADLLYYEETTKGAFVKGNPRFRDDEALAELEPTAAVKILWYEDDYWSVVIVNDGEPAYTAHKYGYCMWVMLPAGGSPLMDEETIGEHGAGVIRALRRTLRYQNRLLSQVATIVARDANPAVTITTNKQLPGGTVLPEVHLEPGGRTIIDGGAGQSVQPWQTTIRPDLHQYLQGVADEDIDNAGVPALLRGTQLAINSGFQFNVLRVNAEDVLQPMTKGLTSHRTWTIRMLLLLVLVAEREQMLEPDGWYPEDDQAASGRGVPLRVTNRAPGAGAYPTRGAPRYIWTVLDPIDVHVHGVEVEAIVSNMTPQDIAQMGQVASMLTQAGVISEKRAFEDLLGYDDYEAEQTQMLYEQFMKTPEVVQGFSGPEALRFKNPEAYSFWQMQQQQMQMMQMMQQQMTQMQAMMGGGGPPGAGPPAASPGLDSTVIPPQMQPVTGIPGAGDQGAMDAELGALGQQAPGQF